MRYDGPPGMMLDLVGPSPNGVDLKWSHPYSDAQPYRNPSRYRSSNLYTYVDNSPIRYVDPSGLEGQPAEQGSLRRRLYAKVDDWSYGTSTGWTVIDAPTAFVGVGLEIFGQSQVYGCGRTRARIRSGIT